MAHKWKQDDKKRWACTRCGTVRLYGSDGGQKSVWYYITPGGFRIVSPKRVPSCSNDGRAKRLTVVVPLYKVEDLKRWVFSFGGEVSE